MHYTRYEMEQDLKFDAHLEESKQSRIKQETESNNKKILVVVAHHDDEVLGCGGTLYKEKQNGSDIKLIVISEGRDTQLQDCEKSSNVLGINKVHNMLVEWNKLDSIPLADITSYIENIIVNFKPNILITHDNTDLNKEHKLVYEAVMVATRPINPPYPSKVIAMPVLSSKEYNYDEKFKENMFIELDEKCIEKKQKALMLYKSEVQNFPNPRSVDGIRVEAMYVGKKINTRYAEEFRIIRNIQGEL